MPLRFNKGYVGTMWFLCGVALLFVGLVTWAPLSPGTRWQWRDTLLSYTFCMVCLAALLWSIHRNRHTVLSAEGISQPSLRGVVTLRWNEVNKVGVSPNAITLIGAGAKIVVVTLAYENPRGVAEHIINLVRGVSERHGV